MNGRPTSIRQRMRTTRDAATQRMWTDRRDSAMVARHRSLCAQQFQTLGQRAKHRREQLLWRSGQLAPDTTGQHAKPPARPKSRPYLLCLAHIDALKPPILHLTCPQVAAVCVITR